MISVTIQIDGMSCGHCLNAVNQALGAVAGVAVKSVQMGRAEVAILDSGTTSDDLVTAIEEAGYNVSLVEAG